MRAVAQGSETGRYGSVPQSLVDATEGHLLGQGLMQTLEIPRDPSPAADRQLQRRPVIPVFGTRRVPLRAAHGVCRIRFGGLHGHQQIGLRRGRVDGTFGRPEPEVIDGVGLQHALEYALIDLADRGRVVRVLSGRLEPGPQFVGDPERGFRAHARLDAQRPREAEHVAKQIARAVEQLVALLGVLGWGQRPRITSGP